MRICKVRIDGVKGFGAGPLAVDLDFVRADGTLPHWIVVAGRNGAGKSTFLQAIALAVAGPSAAKTLRETYADWVRASRGSGSALVQLRPSAVDNFSGGGRAPNFEPWAGLSWTRQDDEGPEPVIERAKEGRGWTPARGPWSENPRGWFLAGYGPFRRLSPAPTEAQRLMMTPGRPASLASLFREEASLSEAVLWLQQIYLKRLEGSVEAAQVERSLLRLLDDGLLPEGMRAVKVSSEGLWIQTPTGPRLPLRSLSDGYRTVAALVLDIARQLLNTYGHLRELDDTGPVRFGHEGVVLIDEIDVHLHVSWQQRIGFWLKEHFPRLQFIVSTHSPFICQAADERGLIRLSAPGERRAAQVVTGELYNRVVNGTADDAVMTDLFGLEASYSLQAAELREETAALEAQAATDSISPAQERRLLDLRARLPHTMSSDVAAALRQLMGTVPDAAD